LERRSSFEEHLSISRVTPFLEVRSRARKDPAERQVKSSALCTTHGASAGLALGKFQVLGHLLR
jgi:hypothetical protein